MKNVFGDTVKTALKPHNAIQHTQRETFANFSIELGQIQAVYTVNDSQNNQYGNPGKYTVYDVLLYRANGATELLPRCRMMQPTFGGGINNNFECTTPNPGTQVNQVNESFDQKAGGLVLVAFLGGQKQQGIIIGGFPSANSVTRDQRAALPSGTVMSWEFQGFLFQINNDGEWTVQFNGPSDNSGNPVSSVGPTTMQLNKEGGFTLKTNSGQQITVDPPNDQIQLKTNAGVELNLTGATLAIGSSTVEVLDQLIQLIQAITVETHISSVPGFATSPPINVAQYTAIQQKLQQLKGSIS